MAVTVLLPDFTTFSGQYQCEHGNTKIMVTITSFWYFFITSLGHTMPPNSQMSTICHVSCYYIKMPQFHKFPHVSSQKKAIKVLYKSVEVFIPCFSANDTKRDSTTHWMKGLSDHNSSIHFSI